MKFTLLDTWIVLGYLVATIGIGFYVSRRASKDLKAYFLGGNSIPWYLLGLSNASGMFDISGTMWTVSIFFIYGMQSSWIPWLWPVWNQIFMMIFLALWLRRSGAMTGAEWLKTRFGKGLGTELSHLIVVIFATISVVAFIAYSFEGVGKFAATFFPWDLSFTFLGLAFSNVDAYALLIVAITTIYVVKGGMYSVVGTEILQFVLMTIACLVVGYIALTETTRAQILAAVPDGWTSFWPGWNLDITWTGLIDALQTEVNKPIAEGGYSLIGFFVMLTLFKGVLASLAGPVPSYDMQRILSTKSPKEAAKMAGITPVALSPRYFMIGGLGVLALVYLTDELNTAGGMDYELILPLAIERFVPAGLFGILIAGLVAAFMSTFAAFINAGTAYLVNDIYKKYINPEGTDKTYVYMGYLASVLVVALGVTLGFFTGSIDALTQWIVSSLYGGYTAANVLKWIWWRFNGFGYFWGMLAGLVGSLLVTVFVPLAPLPAFPIVFAIALAGSLLGTYLSAPEDDATLKDFYKKVRPWGWWAPIKAKVQAEDPTWQSDANLGRDAFNVVVGIAWQMTIITLPLWLVLREWQALWMTAAVLVGTSLVLKVNWWNKLTD